MKFSPRIVLLALLLMAMILVARTCRPQLFCEGRQQKASVLPSLNKHHSLIAQSHVQKKKPTSLLSQEQKSVASLGISRVPAPLDALSQEELLQFPGATLVESAEIDGPEPGQRIRLRLLKTHMKYPLIRIEEIMDAQKNHLLSREEMVATHLLLTLPQGIDPKIFLKIFGTTALSITEVSPEVSLYRLELVSSSLEAVPEALARVEELGGTATVGEPDRVIHSCTIPNDPVFYLLSLWAKYYDGYVQQYDAINAPQAWDVRTDASSVIVAVVDTGIRYTHEDLVDNMWYNPAPTSEDKKGCVSGPNNHPICCGINALDGNGNPMDKEGHGTSCAGIIGAVGNNGIGMAGICWKVQLMACQYADGTGNGSLSDVIVALNYAINHQANIINCSFGNTGSYFSQTEFNTLNRAREQGIIVVCSAGNDGLNEDEYLHFPSSYQLDNIVSVAATRWANTLACFSNYGSKTVHLAAPGDHIYSTSADSDTSYEPNLAGTSFATPHVTGALALLRAQYPHRSHQELIHHLLATTTKVPALADRTISGGILNVGEALTRPLSDLPEASQSSSSSQ